LQLRVHEEALDGSRRNKRRGGGVGTGMRDVLQRLSELGR